ncbi:dephospho-CoA kinase [Limnohabitans sp. Bal53]|uniref:dephospho-CoA kinase n=1 Tax=Limnohabitans sp. Bal53 TaxID=1977910 RepID=UPI000D377C48|nr:dephospho-CoA kinase [Limnohabitans sp. Bal53]PUE40668.1 dephospho-CoA kinase [Limnohabitans sp. Bal53]
MTQRTWRIGLTGGIGSGKSTVAGFLARRGAAIIDADAISRSLTTPGGRAMAAIASTFGESMISPDGAMNRQAMRERIFQDPQAKRQLEHIIHPLVSQVTAEQAQAALKTGHRVLVFDVPLLVESGERWRKQVDRVIVVDCDVSTQKQRVMARSGLNAEEVERIVAQQASRAQRLACADLVVFNQDLSFDGLDSLIGQVAADFGL